MPTSALLIFIVLFEAFIIVISFQNFMRMRMLEGLLVASESVRRYQMRASLYFLSLFLFGVPVEFRTMFAFHLKLF